MQNDSRFSSLTLLLSAHLLPLALVAQAPVVSPNDRAFLEGSSFTHLPLGRASARMQTLHLDVPGGTVISGHAYRRDAAGLYGPAPAFASDIEVSLSMSPNRPDQASASFTQNVGSNPVVVLPRQLRTFPATARPAIDPAPSFDLVVPYQTAFVVPAGGGTVCVDVQVFGNVTPSGPDRNLSLYLDGHQNYGNGDAEQPGYRFGAGCAAPGNTSPTTCAFTMWRLGSQMAFELSLRNGVAEDGSGLTRAWLSLGNNPNAQSWPLRPECPLFDSSDVWFTMPGLLDAQGDYDGTLGSLPPLPAGYRLWAQAGSAHLGNGGLSFGNGVTIVTPPAGPSPIPTCRIVNSNDVNAASGSVSYAVPVMLFF